MIKREIKEHFSNYVSREMNDRELRPWYVAYYGETSEAFLRSCIKLKKLPRLDSLIMIAELFECTVNDLLGFEPIELKSHNGVFNSGIESKHVAKYFMEQAESRGFELDKFEFDEPCMEIEFRRSIRLHRLPDIDVFLQICEALECTPSELLGY